jgi:methylthioribose-1-phosphate isomerase
MLRTLYWDGRRAMILDQVKLPHAVEYIPCTDLARVARCIREMNVRGAPAIGITAAMGIALGASEFAAGSYEEFARKMEDVYAALLATRPTAVNIRWAVERVRRFLAERSALPVADLKGMLFEEAERILQEDIAVNRRIGEWGEKFIADGARVLTHCNAGSLATGGYGTATAPILVAREKGRDVRVFADETRPLLQGARLTAFELKEAGVPVTLITDNSSGALMRRGEIDLAIVGTDRTARNGDVCNKIGTYMVAVLCKENGIPFYVAAPTSSIDFTMASGDLIPIEERAPEEVTNIMNRCLIAPEGVDVRNMAFDVTPAKYVTAIITEKGAFRPSDLHKIEREDADLAAIRL